jgi:hypothetical protein
MKKVFGVSIRMLSFSILAPAFVLGAWAQASHYVPLSFADQLLNSPPCLTIRMAWEGPNIRALPSPIRNGWPISRTGGPNGGFGSGMIQPATPCRPFDGHNSVLFSLR